MIDNHCKFSTYKYYANQSFAFFNPDTEEQYNKNMIAHKEIMLRNNWDTRSIDYTFNNDGFRSDELTVDADGIMFLGCSLVFGLGLELEHVWTYNIAKEYKLQHWNFGINGASADMCFRLGHYWIPRLKPKAVCFLMPDYARKEYSTTLECGDRVFIELGSWELDNDNLHKTDTYLKYVMDDINGELNQLKNKLALQCICDQLNIPLVCKCVNTDFEFEYITYPDADDFARDLEHPGIETNKKTQRMFTTALQEIK